MYKAIASIFNVLSICVFIFAFVFLCFSEWLEKVASFIGQKNADRGSCMFKLIAVFVFFGTLAILLYVCLKRSL